MATTIPMSARRVRARAVGSGASVRWSVIVAICTACQDVPQDPGQPLGYADVVKYTTNEASAALDKNGQFRLYEPSDASQEITREQAEMFAAAWPQNYSPGAVKRLESDHGGAIDLGQLRVCGRTFYLQSAFQEFDEGARAEHPAHARIFGPWWLVTLCGGGQSQVSLAVASYSTDLRLEKGRFIEPRRGGEWFSSVGIPRSEGFNWVESPEGLVVRMGGSLGRRVTAPPILLSPATEAFPNHPRWQLDVDAPVTARTTNRKSADTRRIFSWRAPGRPGPDYQAALPEQPSGVPFRYPDFTSDSPDDRPLKYLVGVAKRRPEFPVAFENVTLEGGN